MVQGLRLCISIAGFVGLIPGQGIKIPHALWPKNQNIKQKQYCNKFNKDFKNGPHQKIINLGPEYIEFISLFSQFFLKFSIILEGPIKMFFFLSLFNDHVQSFSLFISSNFKLSSQTFCFKYF